jgi:hypothetical protein
MNCKFLKSQVLFTRIQRSLISQNGTKVCQSLFLTNKRNQRNIENIESIGPQNHSQEKLQDYFEKTI